MPLPPIATSMSVRVALDVGAGGQVSVTMLNSRADLNAHAKEFVPTFSPCFSAAPRTPQLSATLLSTTSTGVQLVAYYDAQGRYLYTGPYDPTIAALVDHDATGFDDASTSLPDGVDQSYVDAALAMLADAFPLYSTEQLYTTFAEKVCSFCFGFGFVTGSFYFPSHQKTPLLSIRVLM